MSEIYEITLHYLRKLMEAKSKKSKLSILNSVLETKTYVFEILNYTLNPFNFTNYYTFPKITEIDDEPDLLKWPGFIELTSKLRNSDKNTADSLINEALNTSSVDNWNNFYRLILNNYFFNAINVNDFVYFCKKSKIDTFNLPKLSTPTTSKNKMPLISYFAEQKLEGKEAIILLNKNPPSIKIFNQNYEPQETLEFECLLKVVESLPLSVVIIAVKINNALLCFDILPLGHFENQIMEISLDNRNEALLSLQDLLAEHCSGRVRLLPKKQIKLDSLKQLEQVKDDFRNLFEAKAIVLKDIGSFYTFGRNSGWFQYDL